MKSSSSQGLTTSASLVAGTGVTSALAFKNTYTTECYDSEGNLKWKDVTHNIVTDEGLTDILENYFRTAIDESWYCGLKNTNAVSGTDTGVTFSDYLTSHDDGTNQAITWNAASGGTITSTATAFAITGTMTVGGAYITNVANKASPYGKIYGIANFSGGSRAVVNGDTLNITLAITTQNA